MSNAVSTTGILVERAPFPAAAPFTTVAELVSVTPPPRGRNKIETSTHNDGTESNVLGIIRQGDMPFRVNWLPGDDPTHDQVEDDFENNTKAVWRVRFPSGVTLTAPGRVSNLSPVDAPPDAAQQADMTIVWAGPIVRGVAP